MTKASAVTTKNRILSRIEELPEDVLALFATYIFEDSGVAGSFTLSHTSATFRRVVLNLSALWIEIFSTSHIDEVKTCIERSKDAGLQVHFIARDPRYYSSQEIRIFLDAVLPEVSRWKEVTIGPPQREAGANSALTHLLVDMQKHCIEVDLPGLESLNLLYTPEVHWSLQRTVTYSQWRSVSKLRRLHCVDFIPPPSPITNSITSMVLHYSPKDRDLVQDVVKFLGSTPTLQELTFVFSSLFLDHSGIPLTQVSLPRLKHLSVQLLASPFESPVIALVTLQVLLCSISTRNLLSFSTSFEFPAHQLYMLGKFDEYLHILVPDPTDYPMLKTLNFAVFLKPTDQSRDQYYTSQDLPPFNFPLRKIPQVEELAFATDFPFEFSLTPPTSDLANIVQEARLRRLLLTCPRLRGGQLFELVDHLEEAGMWDGVERVCFSHCESLKPREIYKIVDANKKEVVIEG